MSQLAHAQDDQTPNDNMQIENIKGYQNSINEEMTEMEFNVSLFTLETLDLQEKFKVPELKREYDLRNKKFEDEIRQGGFNSNCTSRFAEDIFAIGNKFNVKELEVMHNLLKEQIDSKVSDSLRKIDRFRLYNNLCTKKLIQLKSKLNETPSICTSFIDDAITSSYNFNVGIENSLILIKKKLDSCKYLVL